MSDQLQPEGGQLILAVAAEHILAANEGRAHGRFGEPITAHGRRLL